MPRLKRDRPTEQASSKTEGTPEERGTDRRENYAGSILSCDSSRFDYRALAFAPLQPTPDRTYLQLHLACDGLTSRAVWPLDRGIRIISRGRARPRLSINAQTQVVARRSPLDFRLFDHYGSALIDSDTRSKETVARGEWQDIGPKLSFGSEPTRSLQFNVRRT